MSADLPHLQDSGGFFVALLRKVAPLQPQGGWPQESGAQRQYLYFFTSCASKLTTCRRYRRCLSSRSKRGGGSSSRDGYRERAGSFRGHGQAHSVMRHAGWRQGASHVQAFEPRGLGFGGQGSGLRGRAVLKLLALPVQNYKY